MPQDVAVMGVVCLLVIVVLGIRPGIVHHALMAVLSVVVVSAFRSVGAILVVATLILPGATAYLLVSRLPPMLFLSVLHAALSAVLGLHLGLWLNCSIGAAIVVVGAMLFTLAWGGTALTRKLRRASSDALQPVST
jgi:manganese/zinc/iron transport system permease protein